MGAMNVVVTGNEGYIGSVVVSVLAEAGHVVIGIDSGAFREVAFVPRASTAAKQIYRDIREVQAEDLAGADAIIHLAALSNDPVGELDPALTDEINHQATIRLAKLARSVGVSRFIFSSSCSIYGKAGDSPINESAALAPQTAYARSKADAEQGLWDLATPDFSPIFARNATVFGVSPRQRFDLVVSNLTGLAFVTNQIAITSDGTPWRPLIHVSDVAGAFLFLLSAPQPQIHNEAFNIGRADNNVQVRTIAELVSRALPTTTISVNPDASPDTRSYQVDFSKIERLGWQAGWSISEGIEELLTVCHRINLTLAKFNSDHYHTLHRYKKLIAEQQFDVMLRPRMPHPAV